jgi:DNA-binding response OmpR family regulator
MAFVMIVDDDADFSAAAATVLRGTGYEVEARLDTESALAAMQARVPDLVILDVMFPEDPSAGFALARKLRQQGGKLGAVPILLLTAINTKFPLGFSSGDADGEWLPINEFLEKPVDLQHLLARVEAMLRLGCGS